VEEKNSRNSCSPTHLLGRTLGEHSVQPSCPSTWTTATRK